MVLCRVEPIRDASPGWFSDFRPGRDYQKESPAVVRGWMSDRRVKGVAARVPRVSTCPATDKRNHTAIPRNISRPKKIFVKL